MDRIGKALRKLSKSEQRALKAILREILAGNLTGLDVKKLKGHEEIYRVRKGSIRVIFRKSNGLFHILTIERRTDTTYNRF